MPRVGVLQLPGSIPPRAVTACAYLSWFVSAVNLNDLPGKPGGKPYISGTAIVSIGILSIL
jgi:hypothetical protein